MKLQLINGRFSSDEAINILTKMVQVKIKFHEDKIHSHFNEEDIKMQEKRIKQLQKELFEIKNLINAKQTNIEMHSMVEIN